MLSTIRKAINDIHTEGDMMVEVKGRIEKIGLKSGQHYEIIIWTDIKYTTKDLVEQLTLGEVTVTQTK